MPRVPPSTRVDLISCSDVTKDETTERPSNAEPRATFDEAGVDLGLIRAYLALSPMERLRSLQNAVRAIQKFRPIQPPTIK